MLIVQPGREQRPSATTLFIFAVLTGLGNQSVSGTSTLGRRAFQQMIGDAESPTRRFDIIVVYDVKRFGRIDNDEAGYYR